MRLPCQPASSQQPPTPIDGLLDNIKSIARRIVSRSVTHPTRPSSPKSANSRARQKASFTLLYPSQYKYKGHVFLFLSNGEEYTASLLLLWFLQRCCSAFCSPEIFAEEEIRGKERKTLRVVCKKGFCAKYNHNIDILICTTKLILLYGNLSF